MCLEKANNLSKKEVIKNTRDHTKKHVFPKDVAAHSFGHAFKCEMMLYVH